MNKWQPFEIGKWRCYFMAYGCGPNYASFTLRAENDEPCTLPFPVSEIELSMRGTDAEVMREIAVGILNRELPMDGEE